MAVTGRAATYGGVCVPADYASERRDAGMCDGCGGDDGEGRELGEEVGVWCARELRDSSLTLARGKDEGCFLLYVKKEE